MISRISYENTPSSIAKSMFYYIQAAGHFICDSSLILQIGSSYDSFLLLYTLMDRGILKYRNQDHLP